MKNLENVSEEDLNKVYEIYVSQQKAKKELEEKKLQYQKEFEKKI